MDWWNDWEPVLYPMSYLDIENIDQPAAGGLPVGWFVLATIALALLMVWYRMHVARHSFWCMTARREVEVRIRRGCIVSCAAFEDPTTVACARRCVDHSFRMQWPPALPVLARPRGAAELG
jgi:hypothetical protein